VAVSDYSDYPEAAKALPRVADYQGVDMAAILAFKPDLVLAWKGGNKPQDIQKLSSLGLNVFDSAITQIDDIPSELIRLGTLTHTSLKAKTLAEAFNEKIAALKNAYSRETPKNVFYYSWSTPLMTVGPKAWPNKLLNVCGAQTAFYDSPIDYPQVSVSQVLIRQVDVIIAASNESKASLSSFWEPHSDFLDAEIVTVNPDITSRFSLRLADELKRLCSGIN
jgi:vitamin B12 transport system substrate-binding protein